MTWLNFGEDVRKRLGNDANAGFRQKPIPIVGTRGAGRDGMTRGQVGYGQTVDTGYYKNNKDWQQVASSLGISNIDSLNDINQMYNLVNNGRFGGGNTGSKKEEEQVDPNDGRYEVTANDPTTQATAGEPATYSQAGQGWNRQEQGPSGFDGQNLSSFAGRADRFGMADLKGAYQSGYSQADVMKHLAGMQAISGDSGGYLASGGAYRGLQETSMGQISTKFADPDYSAWGTPARAKAETTFGDFDLLANRRAGFSDSEILDFLDENLDVLNPRQKKGVKGGIYETLLAKKPKMLTPPKPPKNLIIGNSNLGNSGYADVVQPNRSAASSSNRSSYGTSQFNRNNFGNANKSGITLRGLNI